MSKAPTKAQQLQRDHRRLKGIQGNVLGLKDWFDAEDLQQVLICTNIAMKRIEQIQINMRHTAKRWSKCK